MTQVDGALQAMVKATGKSMGRRMWDALSLPFTFKGSWENPAYDVRSKYDEAGWRFVRRLLEDLWLPIESAPRDGSPILITRYTEFEAEEGWHVVRWEADDGYEGGGWWQVHDGKSDHPLRGPEPTHWAPLIPRPRVTSP